MMSNNNINEKTTLEYNLTQINEFVEISIDDVKRDFIQLIKNQGTRAA